MIRFLQFDLLTIKSYDIISSSIKGSKMSIQQRAQPSDLLDYQSILDKAYSAWKQDEDLLDEALEEFEISDEIAAFFDRGYQVLGKDRVISDRKQTPLSQKSSLSTDHTTCTQQFMIKGLNAFPEDKPLTAIFLGALYSETKKKKSQPVEAISEVFQRVCANGGFVAFADIGPKALQDLKNQTIEGRKKFKDRVITKRRDFTGNFLSASLELLRKSAAQKKSFSQFVAECVPLAKKISQRRLILNLPTADMVSSWIVINNLYDCWSRIVIEEWNFRTKERIIDIDKKTMNDLMEIEQLLQIKHVRDLLHLTKKNGSIFLAHTEIANQQKAINDQEIYDRTNAWRRQNINRLNAFLNATTKKIDEKRWLYISEKTESTVVARHLVRTV
jgi:hypothetical protein